MPVDFGAAFRPIAPAPPPPPDFAALVDELAQRIIAAIVALPAPEVYVESPPVDVTELVNAVVGLKGPATAGEIAEALAPLIRPPGVPAPAPDLAILTDIKDVLEKLEFRMKGQAFGSSVVAPPDVAKETTLQAVRDRSEYPWSETDRQRVDALGREATLVQVRDYLDTVESLLAQRANESTLSTVLAELRRRPVYKATSALSSIPAGIAYVTVVEFTPAVPVVIEGYNADFEFITSSTYRVRLITGSDASPDVWHGEEVSTTANSWTPIRLNVAAGTRIAVQMVHDQVTAQNVRGTLNYYEEP